MTDTSDCQHNNMTWLYEISPITNQPYPIGMSCRGCKKVIEGNVLAELVANWLRTGEPKIKGNWKFRTSTDLIKID